MTYYISREKYERMNEIILDEELGITLWDDFEYHLGYDDVIIVP